jgi:sulfinoalanine decarboxylase/sulfinoalanine decarboxylase/aspartate 1-decarboxylase
MIRMDKVLKIFEEIVSELLAAEKLKPVADYIPSVDLFDKIDLSLQRESITDEDLKASLKELVLSTPRTATNAFFNQLFGGRNDKAVLGDLLAVVLNNSMYTYKAGGAQIGVEKVIIRTICDMIGWDATSNGTIAPGGSMTNFMSMLMARDAADSTTPYSGVQQKMTVYTSKESHYSTPKNAAFAGIGRDQVRYVDTDNQGRMDVHHLTQLISEDLLNGYNPIMVNCTAGTTVLGSFDPIKPVRELCDAHGMWLHVDGAYCGSVLWSQKYKHLIDGIELVDSFSVNAHKMIGTPLSCSIIVVKNEKYLYDSFSNDASYLYQTDHDSYNPGKTSLQCGRRNDALKFWTLWKSVGSSGIEKIVNHQFELADIARDYIRSNPDYTLYSFDDSIGVCFNYKGISARSICNGLYLKSQMMVGYGSYEDNEFIRFVTINAQNTKQDILNFFRVLEAFVEEMEMVPQI